MPRDNSEQAFQDWMKKVDAALERKCGLSHLDLADVNYRDWFEDGVTPATAASRAYKNELEG